MNKSAFIKYTAFLLIIILMTAFTSCATKPFPVGIWVDENSSIGSSWEFKADGVLVIRDNLSSNPDEGTYEIKSDSITISGITYLNGGNSDSYSFELEKSNNHMIIYFNSSNSETTSNSNYISLIKK